MMLDEFIMLEKLSLEKVCVSVNNLSSISYSELLILTPSLEGHYKARVTVLLILSRKLFVATIQYNWCGALLLLNGG